jgi:hypothetical protein
VSDETTITTETTLDADFPPGTVISITITVGGAEQATQVEAAPQKPRYMGQSRAINGGKA